MTTGHPATEENGSRRKHRKHLQVDERRSSRKGKETAQTVACKPPPGIPRIVVGIPPLILSGEGIDGAGPKEAEGGTKVLADKIRIFKRNPRSKEVAAIQSFVAAKT